MKNKKPFNQKTRFTKANVLIGTNARWIEDRRGRYARTQFTSSILLILFASLGSLAQPTITTVSSYIGLPGNTVTISGTGFNSTPANNRVYFGATKGTVTSASATSMNVTIPVGATFQQISVNNSSSGLTGFSPAYFLPTYDNSPYESSSVRFQPKQDISTFSLPYNVAICDIDGDGKPDILAAYLLGNKFSVSRNISTTGTLTSSSFAASVDMTTGTQPFSLATGDLDGDGKPDVVVVDQVSNTISIFRNTSTPGSISFAARSTKATANSPQFVAIGDIDVDGKPDIAVANNGSNSVSIFKNTSTSGSISVATKVDLTATVGPSGIAIGDLDGNGKPEILVGCYNAATLSIFPNNTTSGTITTGSFGTRQNYTSISGAFCMAIGDIDGDGKPDVAISSNSNSRVLAFRNTSTPGTVSLSSSVSFLTASGPGYVSFADINGDSKPDLVVNCNSGNVVSVFRNTASSGSISTSSFGTRQDFATGTNPYNSAVGDLDGDGLPDIITANTEIGLNTISVLRNSPLGPITGTLTTCVGGTTTLANITTGGSWTSGAPLIASVSASGVVTGVANGTATITYTATPLSTYAIVTINAPATNAGSNVAICDGSSTTLTASGATYYTWMPATGLSATTGSVITAMPSITTTYTVTGNTGGCSASASVTVSVNPLPSVGSISGGSLVSVGSTLSLSASGSGTWGSSDPAIATVSSTGLVSGIAAGTVLISYSISNTCGIAIATKAVTVNPTLSAITGSTSICVGGTTTLSSVDAGGTWSSSNPAIASVHVTTGLVTGFSTGTVIISYSVFGLAAFTVVTVGATPAAISGADGLCLNNTATFTHPASGGTWSSSNTTVATITGTGIVTGNQSGTAAISYYTSATCYRVKIITVYPLPTPLIGSATVCQGSTATLTTSPADGTWTSSAPSVASINTTTGVFSGIAPGTSSVTYTLPTGCHIKRDITTNPLPATITGDGTTCVSALITLASATGGGFWSSSNPSNATINLTTGVMTGIGAGTTTITYMLSSGCLTTAVVTVGATPTAITGTFSICSGSTTTLTSATTGGEWSSDDAGIADVISTTGLVTGIGPGTTIITYSNGTCAATATVTVNTGATAITGSAIICVGQSHTLSNISTGGTWSSGSVSVATINASTGLVTGISAGTATITYTISSGCYSTFVVTVNASLSAIGGSLGVCQGGNTNLTNATSGGIWSSSNLSKATIDALTGIATGINAGTTIISYIASGCYISAVLTVNNNPAAITGIAAICEGSSTTFACSPSGGIWSTDDPAIASVSATGTTTGTGGGITNISYTLGTGCVAARVISVNSAPSAISGSLTACTGASANLTSTPGGGFWSVSSSYVATINYLTGVLTGTHAGTARVSYTSPGGCLVTNIVTVSATPSAITGLLNICDGSSTTLNSTTWSGAWSSSDAAVAIVSSASISSGLVTGTGAGTATISYSNGSCATTTVVTISAGVAATSGTTSLCIGTGTMLSNATAGGTWSSSATAIATVSASGLVAGVSSGTANITYRLSASCFRLSAVTVNAAPSAILGTLSACPGATTTLSHATAGGTWSSSNTTRVTINMATGVATGISAGTATITYSLGSGCIATATLTVNSTPASVNGTATTCEGSTTTLTCATGGGAWSTSDAAIATVTAGLVTGMAAGTATISYALGAGCASLKVVTVNVAPLGITGTATVCTGLTSALSASPAGGAWTSNNTSKATIGAATGIMTGVSAGTANITYALSATCRSILNVTVNTNPAAITGPASMCTGGILAQICTTPGGIWSSSNMAVATINPVSGLAAAVSSGTTTISYVLGSCSSTRVLTVNVTGGSIGGDAVVCVGQTNATLTTGLVGGTWSSSASIIANVHAANGLITGMSAGTANITFTQSPGCIIYRTVTVNPAVNNIIGPTTVAVGNTVTLSNATSGGTWSSSNTLKATVDVSTGDVTGVATGTSGITYYVSTGCYKIRTQTVTSFKLETTTDETLTIFSMQPNPTSGTLLISSTSAGNLEFYSLDGKKVAEYMIESSNQNIFLPENLATGVYLGRFISKNGDIKTVRLIFEQ